MVFWRSEDSGQTWEPPVRVTPPGIGTYAYQDVLLRTSSGRIVLPVYLSLGQSTGPNDIKPPGMGKLVNGQWVSTSAHFFDPHFSASYVCYSDDDGRTWHRNRDGGIDHFAGLERPVQLYKRADGDRSDTGAVADVHAEWARSRVSGVV